MARVSATQRQFPGCGRAARCSPSGHPGLGGNALIYAAPRPAEHASGNGSRELAAVLGRTRTAHLRLSVSHAAG